MSGFITALIKQRIEAKKAGPNTSERLKEIIGIIRKYDYDDGITPEILVGIIQDLGPTSVKIGQIASQQSEYIPAEYADALSKLRSSVTPMDIETVYSQIEKHLGKPVNELFASFDEKPLGSASIGQVHKAVLFDGTVVAVKVRRPGVVDTVARDFALIEKILDSFIKEDSGGIDIKGFISELEKTSKIELDFTNEAANLEKFWENNQGRPGIESPRCYRDYTNEAILTEDFVIGYEVGDTAFVDALDETERDRIAALISDNFASQVLIDGFYHADPHSGNVLIKDRPLDEQSTAVDSETEAEAEDEGEAEDEAKVEAPEAEAEAAGDAEVEAPEAEAEAETENGAEAEGEAEVPEAEAENEAEAEGETEAETEAEDRAKAEASEAEAENGDEAAEEAEAEAEHQLELPEHNIEWIDFGMMGILSTQQRQILIDLVTAIVLKDAYALKRTVLKAARPKGDIDHGALLEMCEDMCDLYTGSDLGDFDLGDLLSTVIGGLQDEDYAIDPFLTNLARGIVAVEGTVKALSPNTNILNFFLDKVDTGLNFDFSNLSSDDLSEMDPEIAMGLLKYLDSVTTSSSKTAQALDMLEKGQVIIRTNLGFEDKALKAVNRIANYAIRAFILVGILIASSLLCTISPTAMETTPLLMSFPVLGSVGYVVSIFFAYRLYQDVKNNR